VEDMLSLSTGSIDTLEVLENHIFNLDLNTPSSFTLDLVHWKSRCASDVHILRTKVMTKQSETRFICADAVIPNTILSNVATLAKNEGVGEFD
jgi:hypothetical protein